MKKKLAALGVLGAVLGATIYAYADGDVPVGLYYSIDPFTYQPYADALRFVDSDGHVDYGELSRHRAALDRFVHALGQCNTEPDLAFWLNAYNALALRAVIDHYPLKSPEDLPLHSFYWAISWPVCGKYMNLNSIQRKLHSFGDARIHFALACAAEGCPALDSTPYMTDTLDGQLNDAGRRFMRERRAVRIDGQTVHLSRLFDWYLADFKNALADKSGSVLQLVWAFLPDTCETRPGCATRGELDQACGASLRNCSIVFDDWDGRLNDVITSSHAATP